MTEKISYKTTRLLSIFLATLFILIVASIFYVVFIAVPFTAVTFSSVSYRIGQFLGLFGFLCISLLVISGDFARLLDRFYGIDKIIKTQRKFAIFTYFVVFSHPLFLILSGYVFLSALIPNFTIFPLVTGVIGLYIFAGVMISSLLYKRVSYYVWQYIHIATYILFFSVWWHGKSLGSSSNFLPIQILFYVAPVFVIAGLLYRANYKLKQRKNRFFIKSIIQETHDTFTLVVEAKQPFNFKPGQFFFLRLDGRKLYARHPFSVSSAPSDKYLSFTIKLGGRFTLAAQKLSPGDEVKIEGPFGNFILDDSNKDVVFIAGGVGITPFMSMLLANDSIAKKKNVLLFYGSRSEKDIIFKRSIDSINSAWLKKVYVTSRQKHDKDNFVYGKINIELLKKYISDFKQKRFYICGPELMKQSLVKNLKQMGVKKEDIIYEDFFW